VWATPDTRGAFASTRENATRRGLTRTDHLPARYDGAVLDSAAQRALFVARLRGGVNRSAIAAIADGTTR
jgi:hypothetical protein